MYYTNYNYHTTHFINSATNISALLSDVGREVAFTGRSNSGKSSAINTLTNQKKLARISKIPGCTQLINQFEVTNGARLIDLPGYGYATTQKKTKYKWMKEIDKYIQKRHSLKGVVILMDIRNPLQLLDQQMIKYAIAVNLPIMLLLTKADKLSFSKCAAQLDIVRKSILPLMGNIQVAKFSSLKILGVDKLKNILNIWLAQRNKNLNKLKEA
ncbi:ribosome biogenesis GTP-binding protein YihA/YsxC [Candidatus Profftia sp. (ex Adelges kitamiensis)]|uniref:ribosome biogenesis GTP-binding protein YihA/YsxC n=1 Tax=Candidatus Profftia sp. (ex Adelges kitamiensis) TaxID=2864218 RepID=UPI001CE2D86F|nr:ribosome biogenesis GTP-binding protein YihA/YsxC [Candidatus Profftia sp. (ex Adelges kitamiensis)]